MSVTRRGKFLVFAFARDRIIVNAMLTGRLGFAVAGDKQWPQIAAVLQLRAGRGYRGRIKPAAWLEEGRLAARSRSRR